MDKEDVSKLKNLLLNKATYLLTKGRIEEGMEKIERFKKTMGIMVPLRTKWINELLGIISEGLGEEHVLEFWRKFAVQRLTSYETESPIKILEDLILVHNALGSNIKNVEEKEDRYILTLDPCGSMGVAMRKNMIDLEKDVTKKAYDFLGNKKGVPYYCVHCVVVGETVPKEKLGRAFWIQDWPLNPEGVCRYNVLK
jgi:hypothetical protein